MNILTDVFKELFKMFVADFRLTMATLVGVGIVALLLGTGWVAPVICGIILITLCIVILLEAVMRETRLRKPSEQPRAPG